MPWIEKEGRSVEEARAAVMAELGLPEDEAEVEVLREGAKGLFGLGGEPALVRARARSEAVDYRSAFESAPPSYVPSTASAEDEDESADPVQEAFEAEAARSFAGDLEDDEAAASGMPLAERQEVAGQVAVEMVKGILSRMNLEGEVTTRVTGGTVYVEVFGEEMGILIGRGGKTLEALQELVRAGVQRRLKARASVVVDVESYWERRREGSRRGGAPRREGTTRTG